MSTNIVTLYDQNETELKKRITNLKRNYPKIKVTKIQNRPIKAYSVAVTYDMEIFA